MKKTTTMMMILMCTTAAGCFFPMEDLPVDDDAESPTVKPDATPAPSPDATPIEEVDAEPIETPDAGTETPDATAPEADATPEEPDATPEETPDAEPTIAVDAGMPDCAPPVPTMVLTATPSTIMAGESASLSWSSTGADVCYVGGSVAPQPISGALSVTPPWSMNFVGHCEGPGGVGWSNIVSVAVIDGCTGGCSDGFGWTSDTCAAGECVSVLTDCGGMQVRLPASAVTCGFWGGFGSAEPAPSLGSFAPSALPVGAAGGNWKEAPEHSCSAICYDASGARVQFDLQTEWDGASDQLAHASWGGVTKGTFDGLNLEW